MSMRQYKQGSSIYGHSYGGRHGRKKTRRAAPVPSKRQNIEKRNDEDYANLGHRHRLTHLRYPTGSGKRPPPKPKRLHADHQDVRSPPPVAAPRRNSPSGSLSPPPPKPSPRTRSPPSPSPRTRSPPSLNPRLKAHPSPVPEDESEWVRVEATPTKHAHKSTPMLPPKHARNKRVTEENSSRVIRGASGKKRPPPQPRTRPVDSPDNSSEDVEITPLDILGVMRSQRRLNGVVLSEAPRLANAGSSPESSLSSLSSSQQQQQQGGSKPAKQPMLPPSIKPRKPKVDVKRQPSESSLDIQSPSIQRQPALPPVLPPSPTSRRPPPPIATSSQQQRQQPPPRPPPPTKEPSPPSSLPPALPPSPTQRRPVPPLSSQQPPQRPLPPPKEPSPPSLPPALPPSPTQRRPVLPVSSQQPPQRPILPPPPKEPSPPLPSSPPSSSPQRKKAPTGPQRKAPAPPPHAPVSPPAPTRTNSSTEVQQVRSGSNTGKAPLPKPRQRITSKSDGIDISMSSSTRLHQEASVSEREGAATVTGGVATGLVGVAASSRTQPVARTGPGEKLAAILVQREMSREEMVNSSPVRPAVRPRPPSSDKTVSLQVQSNANGRRQKENVPEHGRGPPGEGGRAAPVPRKRKSKDLLEAKPEAKKPPPPPFSSPAPPPHQGSLRTRKKGGGFRMPLWKAPPPPTWTPPTTPNHYESRKDRRTVKPLLPLTEMSTIPLSPPLTPTGNVSSTSFILPPFHSSDLSSSPTPPQSSDFERSFEEEQPVAFTRPGSCVSPMPKSPSIVEFEDKLFEFKTPKKPGFQQQLPINVVQELQNNLRKQITKRSGLP